MNLENVEQRSFDYLQQTANPLVPLTTLLRHLWQDAEFAELTAAELQDFLGHNELFRIVNPEPLGETEEELAAAGVPTGPRVILKARIPTAGQMNEMMREQMTTMVAALEKAMDEAVQHDDWQAQGEIAVVLNRATQLKAELDRLFGEQQAARPESSE